jgi:hypothetical protein
MDDVSPSQRARKAHKSTRVHRATEREDGCIESLRSHESDERAVGRRDERNVVTRIACGPGELQGDHLAAGDLAADDDVSDPHAIGCEHTA